MQDKVTHTTDPVLGRESPKTTSSQISESGSESYAQLVSPIYGKLVTVAAAMISDRNEADDLVQEAVMVGLKKYADFESGTNFQAWMMQIVRFQASNWRSKKTRRRTQASDPQLMDQESHTTNSNGNQSAFDLEIEDAERGSLSNVKEEFDEEVLAAIKEIEELPRACLLLRIVHELSYRDIGEMLGIPEGTAMSHVHRVRTKLRTKLSAGMVS